MTEPGVEIAFARLHMGGEIETIGSDRPLHASGTMAVPVLIALLRARGEAGLSGDDHSAAKAAIGESDDTACLHLFGELSTLTGGLERASAAIEAVLRDAGDTRTVVATSPPPPGAVTPFGQTEWRPSDAARFFRALGQGELTSGAQAERVWRLMGHSAHHHRWGLAELDRPAYVVGTGPERGGELVRQSGIVRVRGAHVAVSLAVLAPSLEAGQQSLSAAAGSLRERLG